jgi:hypothetical protein
MSEEAKEKLRELARSYKEAGVKIVRRGSDRIRRRAVR